MKQRYETPVMYVEAFIAEQYVAAEACGTHITKTPAHGHVQIKGGNEIHCAFTSSNCGKSNSCVCGDCDEEIGTHNILTEGTNLNASSPRTGHNCHILDNHEDAVYFVNKYKDKKCGAGVAVLLGVQDFEDIATAWS